MRCFVMMPFKPEFDRVYDTIKAAGDKLLPDTKINFHRLDEGSTPGPITDDLVREIHESDFCLADLSGHNPNVMWEAGYARALGKLVVQVIEEGDTLPFDMSGVRTFKYRRENPETTLLPQLMEALPLAVQQVQREDVQQLRVLNTIRLNAPPIHGIMRTIDVHRLPKGDPLDLDWLTLARGIEEIEKQIKKLPRISFDMIVGLNACGTLIASYLSGACERQHPIDRPVMGVKSTHESGVTKERTYHLFPCNRYRSTRFSDGKYRTRGIFKLCERFESVLLVDSEFKEGNSVRRMTNFIEQRFLKPGGEVYLAVLAACFIDPLVDDMPHPAMEDVFAKSRINPEQRAKDQGLPFQVPHFLAYLTEGRVEPPGGIT